MFNNNIFAVQEPRVLNKEKRFRTYIYNPNDVYRYVGYYLNQSYIEFEEDETVTTISMGDSTAWQTSVLGNKLFLKPWQQFPQTKMTIFTNKRTYYFELDAMEPDDADPNDILFFVKFLYPTSSDKNIVKFNVKSTRDDYPDLDDLSKYNFNYEFAGSPSIAPIKVFDDGLFTYMEFKIANAEVPAIFTVNDSGYESLVNFRIVEEYVVIEQVSGQFTLRSGGDVVCVYNNSLYRFE
jgi:type IV secretion system protein VirB9